MLKKFKNFLLNQREVIEDERLLRLFGKRLRDPRLWYLNRNGIAAGTAVGLFCAFLPMPMQFLPATIGAIAVRGNLPLAFALIWISNPLTWIPFYTPAYKLGTRILGIHDEQQSLSSIGTMLQGLDGEGLRQLIEFLAALWIGCLVCGAILGTIGYFIVLYSWRLHVISRWKQRREVRKRASRLRKQQRESGDA